MKTFRRDKLRRLIEAGKVRLAGSYHFDDMMGESRSRQEMPVAIYPDSNDWRDCKQGVCYIRPWEFKSQSGGCWRNPNGTITLIVHSNSNYDFRIEG